MNTLSRHSLLSGTAACALLFTAGLAHAQEQAQAPVATTATDTQDPAQSIDPNNATSVEDIVVVGSQIRGASTTTALPVVVMGREQIDAVGASSGDELMRSIPQMGDVLFDSANNPQTSNSARGDVNSVNLRSLGVGNTLVLLNGRRLVQHPTSQGTSDTGTVPVQSFNSNAIPVSGLERVEVLLDGAAAIYGADAVAGVVNTVLRDDMDGLEVTARYGGAEGTHLREFELELAGGKDLERGNISFFANYSDRTALLAEDHPFTATDDLRSLFAQYDGYGTTTVPDGRSSHSPWAQTSLAPRTTATRPRSNGVLVTNTAGAFHLQPESFGCVGYDYGDTCLVQGALAYNSTNREMRYDTRWGTTVRPSVERLNLYATGRFEVTSSVEAFFEAGFYSADSRAVQPPVVNLNRLWIPASNYWNPFGPVRFADNSLNPNRLPNLTNVPVEGLPVSLGNYRFVDAGFQVVKVENFQSRFLAGLTGEWRGFDWETALLYSAAEATDRSPNINMTALQANLALSTPDAYNPFNGGCVGSPSFNDCTPSSQAAIDAITFEMKRFSRTTLTMGDFRISRNDLLQLPAGSLGMAAGIELRRETQLDDRDENLDGTFTFTDSVSGETNLSNVSAVSPNPDTRGSRTVSAAYVEFAVPVVSPEMNIPLVRSLDIQIAGRAEHYSDFGSVAKPKVAMAWDVFDGLRLRASYSEGFRAPNLEQTHATQYARLSSGTDYIKCEQDLRAGRITAFSACSATDSLSLLIAGNPDLQPEESTNQSVGLVFQPQFLPQDWGNFTFTVDRWKIEQEQIVGLLGTQTALALDYLLRVNGSSNPNVVRAAPTQTEIDNAVGTGLAAVGDVLSINDQFINLLPQSVEGVDFGFRWEKRRTAWGSFTAQINAAQLLEFRRDPGPIVDSLYAARDAGTINALTTLPDPSDLIAQNGRPEWKVSTSFTWRHGAWRAGLSTQSLSDIYQADLLSDTGVPWTVKGRTVANVYAQYDFDDLGWAGDTSLRVGVRDLTDEGPSLADGGYRGTVNQPYGRYFWARITTRF